MSWRATLACTRAQAEALPDAEDLFGDADAPPVLVVDEPDPHQPDAWLLHAYFPEEPAPDALALLQSLADGPARVEQLPDEDWVSRSQAGLEPIRAGRFFVHTPAHRDSVPAGATAFEIDAGLAFGTGQHHTTHGCLVALDRLAQKGAAFASIADIGSGTGLLAFAARALWPDARVIATDIDAVAVDVAADNARINGIPLGEGFGEVALAVADGMASPALLARAPYDLLIANILAGPLIELAPAFAAALAPGATVILAGLLDTQVAAVSAAYARERITLLDAGQGEWPVLVLRAGP
jgi:ribosomal protein L11 methyltransferase